uniref:Uncharacterized protein n=1 Tax=Magnetospirillum gryphiswaldense TaxID=55518 RepID=A4TZV3_9PROT|nr:hypothetical protein MGR_1433 [Magnetospirillum gryphiswaldense MSR-1]
MVFDLVSALRHGSSPSASSRPRFVGVTRGGVVTSENVRLYSWLALTRPSTEP